MEPEDWTPAKGWIIALRKVGLRGAIVFAVIGAILYFAWPAEQHVPPFPSFLGLVFFTSAVVGYPAGYAVVRKLTEDSGLSDRALMLPVLIVMTLINILAYHVVLIFRGGGGMLTVMMGIGLGFWSAAAVLRTLLTE